MPLHSRLHLLFGFLTKFRKDPAKIFHDRRHFLHHAGGERGGLREVGAGFGAVVLEPGDVERVIATRDPLAGKLAEAAGLAGVLALLQCGGSAGGIIAEGFLELGEVVTGQRGALAEVRHVRAQVIDPDFLGVALVGLATGEEQDVGVRRREAGEEVEAPGPGEHPSSSRAVGVRDP